MEKEQSRLFPLYPYFRFYRFIGDVLFIFMFFFLNKKYLSFIMVFYGAVHLFICHLFCNATGITHGFYLFLEPCMSSWKETSYDLFIVFWIIELCDFYLPTLRNRLWTGRYIRPSLRTTISVCCHFLNLTPCPLILFLLFFFYRSPPSFIKLNSVSFSYWCLSHCNRISNAEKMWHSYVL